MVAPIEEVLTQQGERSGGNHNNCVTEIGCDEGRERAQGLAHYLRANASMDCNEGKDRNFALGECLRVLFE